MNKYPIFVISYNRQSTHTTARQLAKFGFDCFLVVHRGQLEEYKKNLTEEELKYITLLEFDDSYKYKYETCDNIPHRVKNAGSGAERNFAWDYSIKLGYKAHWLMDDNMHFYRIVGKRNDNYVKKIFKDIEERDEFIEKFISAENFFDKYENLLMLELAENNFCIKLKKLTYALNTRCFSCNLIYNNMPIRWRGRYNEDVILSTDIMVSGYCIASYYAGVLKAKQSTREAKGGNHAKDKNDKQSIYDDSVNYRNSSIDKTNLLLSVYPNFYRKVIKYGRVHHEYRRENLKKIYKNLILAKKYGDKNVNKNDFKKIRHYEIPK